MVQVYLDACCLNRPFDDQTQNRIRLEAEAVLLILSQVEAGRWQWVGSEALDYEIEQTPNAERRMRVRLMTKAVHRSIKVEAAEEARAQQLATLGFHALDALHLACAESGGADVLLTTDDRLLRLAVRLSAQLHIRVENPLTWLQEIESA
ncbi:MAG: PIN domain-containing protein [Pyrinomonadaceae bacterium]